MRRLFCVVATLTMLTACSSDGSDSEAQTETTTTSTREKPATTTTAPAEPTAALLFTYTDPDPLVRFAAEISNPSDKSRVGLRTTWKALDANGVIVGTFEDRRQPSIPAGGSILYVGGAGLANLNGVPAEIRIEISDPGSLVDEPPAPLASSEAVSFKRADYDFIEGARTYDVTFTLVALQELNTADIDMPVVLRDAAGTIIGADFADSSGLPTRMAPGEKALVTTTVWVTNGEPATAEALAQA